MVRDLLLLTSQMSLDELAAELLLQIFRSCTSVADVLNLARTCRRLHGIFSTSHKLPILYGAIEAEYGPAHEIMQLITQNSSQMAHLIRSAPLSITLIQQMVEVGRVAKRWEQIYPLKKWKVDHENRRFLSEHEQFALRRAVYRLWLYSRAFHCSQYPRTSRVLPEVMCERAELLHNWSTVELAEMEDARLVIREVVQNHICPSNGTIQRKFRKRYPENTPMLAFNIHLNYAPGPATTWASTEGEWDGLGRCNSHTRLLGESTRSNRYATKFRTDLYHEPGAEGWGDEINHYYVVEDMLKLNPAQILWLREHAPFKGQVLQFVWGLGEWFENNGETFGQTVDFVLAQRDEMVADFRGAIEDRELGVAV